MPIFMLNNSFARALNYFAILKLNFSTTIFQRVVFFVQLCKCETNNKSISLEFALIAKNSICYEKLLLFFQ